MPNRCDYGMKFFCFWWKYNLSAACRFMDGIGHHLRAYGITIPFSDYGVFVVKRVKQKDMLMCDFTFPSDNTPLIQIFKQSGDPPFVCGFRGNPIGIIEDIEREYCEDDELHDQIFTKGDGEYLFAPEWIPEEYDYSVTPERISMPGYWDLDLVAFRPVSNLDVVENVDVNAIH